MRDQNTNDLVDAVLGTDVSPHQHADVLQGTLRAVRRKRRVRLVGRGLAVAMTCGLAWAFYDGAPSVSTAREPMAAQSEPESSVVSRESGLTVKSLSDAELLALFPDEPVALVGNGSDYDLVFLDRPLGQNLVVPQTQ